MTLITGSIQLGLIYSLLALGIYLSFRILNTPDLTADGSFTLGVAVSAALTVTGHPILAILVSVLAGAAAGAVTGMLQTKLGIHPILSGILTMSGLYSVNLFILGSRSNLSLIGSGTIFSAVQDLLAGLHKDLVKIIVALLFCAICLALLAWFLGTHLGLCIRATGNNEDMVRASSIDVDAMRIIALAISNACISLSGAVLAQYQGFADISSGIGIVVVGLASVIIGEVFFGSRGVIIGLCGAVIGSLAYRFVIAAALKSSLFPAFTLKLVSAVIVAAALAIPAVKGKIAFSRLKRRAGKDA